MDLALMAPARSDFIGIFSWSSRIATGGVCVSVPTVTSRPPLSSPAMEGHHLLADDTQMHTQIHVQGKWKEQ